LSILSHIKGAISGFAKGGISGAISGAIGGQNNAPPASKVARLASSPNAFGTVNQYSANGLVRYASTSGALVPMPSQAYPTMPGSGFSGGGATGSFAPGTSTPMWAYRRLYTKKGTPRRIRRDGLPYAIPRMNAMNVRSARRAIRRIRGARKLLQRIERSLPKQTHRRRAA
jgi:hypothetical protein